jgi:CubicO group peptidase (beta-lactamase class C family)
MLRRHGRRTLAIVSITLLLLAASWIVGAIVVYPFEYVKRVVMLRESRAEYYLDFFPTRVVHSAELTLDIEEAPDASRAELELESAFQVRDAGTFLEETQTQAFIVLQNDRVIFERYPGEWERDSIVTSFSVAKSITSLLIGIAIDEGLIHSVDDPITDYLPELRERDPEFTQITIRHLLNMASGLEYQEMRWFLFNGDDPLTTYHPDQREISLNNAEIIQAPGEVFSYNKYHPQLLGMILERVSGMSVSEWTQSRLWEPAGMEYDAAWTLDSHESGFEKMEAGFNARAIDFARLGQLVLHDGELNGTRIVSEDWVRISTGQNADGRSPEFDDHLSYGFMWWIIERDGATGYFAAGDHGQFIFINLDTRVVIIRNGLEYGISFDEWAEGLLELSVRPAD